MGEKGWLCGWRKVYKYVEVCKRDDAHDDAKSGGP
jgi:hypothetical protein